MFCLDEKVRRCTRPDTIFWGPDKEGYSVQLFSPQFLSYYYSESYVVGTQKNRLSDTILLSTHNIGVQVQIRIL